MKALSKAQAKRMNKNEYGYQSFQIKKFIGFWFLVCGFWFLELDHRFNNFNKLSLQYSQAVSFANQVLLNAVVRLDLKNQRLKTINQKPNYSHSIVAGGLLLISYTTRLMPFTELMISLDTSARKS